MSRVVDEWGTVVQRQNELSRQLDQATALNRAEAKKTYRQELEYQQYLKNARAQHQKRQEIAEDYYTLQNRLRSTNEQESHRRSYETSVKRMLADNYQQYISMRQQQANQEKQQKHKEQLKRLEDYRLMKIEDEARRRGNQRILKEEQQAMMRFSKQFNEHQKELAILDKQEELKMILANQEQKVNTTPRKYQPSAPLPSTPLPSPKIDTAVWAETKSSIKTTPWERNDDDTAKTKVTNARKLNDSLRQQLLEKEQLRTLERAGRLKETEDVLRRVELSKKIENDRNRQKKMMQTAYRNELMGQALLDTELKSRTRYLTDTERKINSHVYPPPNHNLFLNSSRFFGVSLTPSSRQSTEGYDKITRMPVVHSPIPRPAGMPSTHNIW